LERRRELATLQALGASQGQVIGLLLWEAGYLGALGGGLGIAGGVWLAAVLVWVINKQSFGWTIPLTIPADVLGSAAVLSIGTALAAAYWPAHWIASRSAVEGLRYE
jgi:putative ABC transport system permease protein